MGIKHAMIAASIWLAAPGLASANTVNSQALELASNQNFSQALALLSAQSPREQTTYEHRFLKARILSWDQQYNQARQEFDALMREHPGNSDLHLALGNLEFYQGNLDAAQAQYEIVLSRTPDYDDARQGLMNVERARENQRSRGNPSNDLDRKHWRIDGGIGVSDFDNDALPKWNEQFLRVEYSPETLSYHASVQRYDRFGLGDIALRAGVADAVRGGWDWGLDVGGTPDAKFRPELSIGGRLGRSIELENGLVLYPNVNVRTDDYATGNIQTVQPDLTAYLSNGTILTGRLIATLQKAEKDQLGWLLEGRHPLTNRLQVRAGYAHAPEAINGFAVTTKSLFGGLTYRFREDLDLHLNLSRDDRENSFVRNSANVSFTYRQ
jgi:YaiO family outer membrane protein